MNFFSDVQQWGNESKKGLVCGIFRCNEPVESRCSICKHGYCTQHKNSHFHHLTKFGVK